MERLTPEEKVRQIDEEIRVAHVEGGKIVGEYVDGTSTLGDIVVSARKISGRRKHLSSLGVAMTFAGFLRNEGDEYVERLIAESEEQGVEPMENFYGRSFEAASCLWQKIEGKENEPQD